MRVLGLFGNKRQFPKHTTDSCAKEALLVIDIDHGNGWFDDETKLSQDQKKVAGCIKVGIARARARGMLIIFITFGVRNDSQTDYTGSCLICERDDNAKLAGFLEHKHSPLFEPAFIKNSVDAFVNERLGSFLRERRIEKLYLVGCTTFGCVLSTAKGALEEGFNVTLISGCTFPRFDNTVYYKKREWINSTRSMRGGSEVCASII